MVFKIQLAIASLAAIWTSMGLSGVISSGGGSIKGDTANPWFVKNTKTVNYCIEVDEKNFHHGSLDLDLAIQAGLAYWKKQFSSIENPTGIATQIFKKTSCQNDVNITFRFGTLTSLQRKQLGENQKFLAITYREDYDSEHMRARGFIYLAADSGSLKYDGKHINDWPWQNPIILYRALAHELGHVFGVPHIPDSMLMEEEHLEYISSIRDGYIQLGMEIDGILFSNTGTSIHQQCFFRSYMPQLLRDVFAIPEPMNCLFFNFEGNDISVSTAKDWREPKMVLGLIKVASKDSQLDRSIVRLFLPETQIIFTKNEENHSRIRTAAFSRTIQITGTYAPASSPEDVRELGITIPSNGRWPKVSAFYDGKLSIDLLNGNR